MVKFRGKKAAVRLLIVLRVRSIRTGLNERALYLKCSGSNACNPQMLSQEEIFRIIVIQLDWPKLTFRREESLFPSKARSARFTGTPTLRYLTDCIWSRRVRVPPPDLPSMMVSFTCQRGWVVAPRVPSDANPGLTGGVFGRRG